MSGAIYMAASGGLAYEKRLQIISNNLANANTTGFKMDQGYFRIQDPTDPSGQTHLNPWEVDSTQAREFWMQFNMYTDFSNGGLKHTGSDFDLALVGDGFFCVKTPDGVRYTRNGNFTLNSEGVLVTDRGYPVLGQNGEIVVQSKEDPFKLKQFAVDYDGSVKVDGQEVGSLRLVDFDQPYRLKKVGDTLFEPEDSSVVETPADKVTVSQGFLEQSNVDAIMMMTEMIEVLRGYESYQKVIRSVDETTAKAINDVGRTA